MGQRCCEVWVEMVGFWASGCGFEIGILHNEVSVTKLRSARQLSMICGVPEWASLWRHLVFRPYLSASLIWRQPHFAIHCLAVLTGIGQRAGQVECDGDGEGVSARVRQWASLLTTSGVSLLSRVRAALPSLGG